MKKYIPFCKANSIYDIDTDFFKKIGASFLLIDLDNTLDSPHTSYPSNKTKELIKKIKSSGLTPVIISNNSKKRVSLYAKELNIEYLSRSCKPFIFKLKRYINCKNISLKSVIIIGDQIMTDVLCANNLEVKCVLTSPLYEKDQLITFINRRIDIHYRKKLDKLKLNNDWRTIYAKI